MSKTGVIYGINGPVIYVKGNTGFQMHEMVYVGQERLVGEVISLDKDTKLLVVVIGGSKIFLGLFCIFLDNVQTLCRTTCVHWTHINVECCRLSIVYSNIHSITSFI